MKTEIRIFLALTLLASSSIMATASTSQYAGEQTRKIKSLSEQDVNDLLQGKGWGLAKAAELNGMPGPLHLLEMKERIDLSQQQLTAINLLYASMKSRAMVLGRQLVDLEASLNDAFHSGSVNESHLQQQLFEIGRVRSELRFVHLSAHLQTPSILNAHQLKKYNQLRGYAGDPCESIPEGHDPVMWKKHNGCE